MLATRTESFLHAPPEQLATEVADDLENRISESAEIYPTDYQLPPHANRIFKAKVVQRFESDSYDLPRLKLDLHLTITVPDGVFAHEVLDFTEAFNHEIIFRAQEESQADFAERSAQAAIDASLNEQAFKEEMQKKAFELAEKIATKYALAYLYRQSVRTEKDLLRQIDLADVMEQGLLSYFPASYIYTHTYELPSAEYSINAANSKFIIEIESDDEEVEEFNAADIENQEEIASPNASRGSHISLSALSDFSDNLGMGMPTPTSPRSPYYFSDAADSPRLLDFACMQRVFFNKDDEYPELPSFPATPERLSLPRFMDDTPELSLTSPTFNNEQYNLPVGNPLLARTDSPSNYPALPTIEDLSCSLRLRPPFLLHQYSEHDFGVPAFQLLTYTYYLKAVDQRQICLSELRAANCMDIQKLCSDAVIKLLENDLCDLVFAKWLLLCEVSVLENLFYLEKVLEGDLSFFDFADLNQTTAKVLKLPSIINLQRLNPQIPFEEIKQISLPAAFLLADEHWLYFVTQGKVNFYDLQQISDTEQSALMDHNLIIELSRLPFISTDLLKVITGSARVLLQSQPEMLGKLNQIWQQENISKREVLADLIQLQLLELKNKSCTRPYVKCKIAGLEKEVEAEKATSDASNIWIHGFREIAAHLHSVLAKPQSRQNCAPVSMLFKAGAAPSGYEEIFELEELIEQVLPTQQPLVSLQSRL